MTVENRVENTARVRGPSLSRVWRRVGIGAWLVILLVSLAAWVLSISVWNRWDRGTADESIQQLIPPHDTAQDIQNVRDMKDAVRSLGFSFPVYADFFSLLRVLSGIPYFVLSALIIRRSSDRLMAVLFAMTLAAAGAAGRYIQPNWAVLASNPDYPWMAAPVWLLDLILNSSVILLYTLPDGRFVPRWTRWAALFVVVWQVLSRLPESFPLNPRNLPGAARDLIIITFFLGVFAIVYRYRRDASAVQKQQLKWIIAGFLPLALLYLVQFGLYDFPYNLTGRPLLTTMRQGVIYNTITEPLWYVAQILFSVATGMAIFRYRLWEVDLVLNRALVYGSLTLLSMGVYLGAVFALGYLFHSLTSPVIFFLATGLAAILFEPLRRRLQRLVNRLMYGERDDPYAVLTRLSNTLEQAPAPGAMLPAIAATVGQALKIPYVALQVHQNGADQLVALYGQPQPEYQVFPLVYQGEAVGSLYVSPRARGEAFSNIDLRLIENIARQAGAAAQAARLNAALVRSRAEIVAAREEERRRLRRDLHDGLGPVLASQTLKMAAVRQLVRQSPERAEELIDNVIKENENTVGELRRLVYGLRPPALDELGLVEAVRDLVRRAGKEDLGGGELEIAIAAPEEGLPRLPAAVETAAYRIALEGLTNTVRHARAKHCAIAFRCETEPLVGGARQVLQVQISDDGVGIPTQYRAGVGLRSMHERAEELGGELRIAPGDGGGAQITAWLPLDI